MQVIKGRQVALNCLIFKALLHCRVAEEHSTVFKSGKGEIECIWQNLQNQDWTDKEEELNTFSK